MKRTIFTTLVVGVLCAATCSRGLAHTFKIESKTCPLCETTFQAILDASGTKMGMRLDLRPLGRIAAPWRVPVCPNCHFVIFAKEIAEEHVEQCKRIVATEKYKQHSKRASYYLMGLLFEGLKKDPAQIAHAYLKASWQEESHPKKLKEDLELSHKHFAQYLGAAKTKDESWEHAQLVSGEIERRLGKFKKAKARFTNLRSMGPFKCAIAEQAIELQLELIEKKDTKPHSLPQ